MSPVRSLKVLAADEINLSEADSLSDDMFAFVLARQLGSWTRHIQRGHTGLGNLPPLSPRADLSILAFRGHDTSVRLIGLRTHVDVLLTTTELDEVMKEAERLSVTGGCFLSAGRGRKFRECPIFTVADYKIRVCVHTRL